MAEDSPTENWVCLAGGNALGAFHLGVVEALLDANVPVRRVAGASIGAVTAALWLGGPRETAMQRLRTFWARAEDRSVFAGLRAARQTSAMRALLGGRPRLFNPTVPGIWAIHPLAPNDDHLHSTVPMRQTLTELIDFDRLNNGETRLIVNALDQRTSEDVVFDSATTRLTVDHLMASSALPLIFPPVEIDGHLLVDAGLSANLPIAAIFGDLPDQDVTCWAADLWPPTADRAISPDTVARRMQDLMFAAQSRHALERLADSLSPRLLEAGRTAAVHHLGYDGGAWEVAAKAFDYSRAAVRRRYQAGRAGMKAALSAPQAAQPGFAVTRHVFSG